MEERIQEPKNKGGRRAYEATPDKRDQVRRLAMLGIPQTQIAAVMKICRNTLRTVFKEELVDGSVGANERVMTTLYELATTERSVAATIFWAKTRCGYRQTLGHVDAESLGEMVEGEVEEESAGPMVQIVVRENGGEPPELC